MPNTWIAAGQRESVDLLSRALVDSLNVPREVEGPFFHLEFDRVFPEDVYAWMLAAMPEAADYRPMHGRSRDNDLADGTHTRVKIDLLPEYIRHLPPRKHAVWEVVGRALCSDEVRDVFVRRLAPALRRRFGANFTRIGMYPIPVLTRDITQYRIFPHTDALERDHRPALPSAR